MGTKLKWQRQVEFQKSTNPVRDKYDLITANSKLSELFLRLHLWLMLPEKQDSETQMFGMEPNT